MQKLKICSRNCLAFFNGLRSGGSCTDVFLHSAQSLRLELVADALAVEQEAIVVEEEVVQIFEEEEEIIEAQAKTLMDKMLTGTGLKWMFGIYWSIFSFMWFLVLLVDWKDLWNAKRLDFSGTYTIVVAPKLSCNLSTGRAWLDFYPGASVKFPPTDPQAPATCWQAGSLALALIDMGLNGTLLFRDTLLSENLPRAILKAEQSNSHKRTAVITFDHALSQNLVQRPWIANLLGVQPPDVHWASIGNNLFHDRLARDVDCSNQSECGCSDPNTGYMDCLAGVFNLVTVPLHDTVTELHHTIQAAQLTSPHEIPEVGFANHIVAGVAKSSRPAPSEEIRVLVDCGRRLGHLPNKEPEDLLDILFAGVYKFQSRYSENRTIVTTLLNCKDDRATIVELQQLSHSQFLHMISSSDVYTSVTATPSKHVAGFPEAQMIGVPILSLGGIVAPELFQEGISGFTVAAPADVEWALEKIEQRLGNDQWRRRIHDWAQQSFSARKAAEEILSQLFELPLHDSITVSQ